jgi:hypothetical protein
LIPACPVNQQQPPAGKFLPFSQRLMMSAAQPTPGVTLIASTGQFIAQAPHSMQPSLSMISAFFPANEKTPWGQTCVHIPQPMHVSPSNLIVAIPSI